MTTPLLADLQAHTLHAKKVQGPSFAIGIVHGAEWDGWFGASIVNLLTSARNDNFPISEVICVRSGPALQLGRGVLVNSFLENTTAEALLMLDSDMWFDPSVIRQHWDLFNREVDGGTIDVLSGLAFIASAPRADKPGTILPNIWAPNPHNPDTVFQAVDYPQNTLLKVASAGAACLMIRRQVLIDINVHHFHHIKILNYGMLARKFASSDDALEIEEILRKELMDADEYGEDMSFCMRAKAANYSIYQHTGLHYGHSKNIVLTEEDYNNSRADAAKGES